MNSCAIIFIYTEGEKTFKMQCLYISINRMLFFIVEHIVGILIAACLYWFLWPHIYGVTHCSCVFCSNSVWVPYCLLVKKNHHLPNEWFPLKPQSVMFLIFSWINKKIIWNGIDDFFGRSKIRKLNKINWLHKMMFQYQTMFVF